MRKLGLRLALLAMAATCVPSCGSGDSASETESFWTCLFVMMFGFPCKAHGGDDALPTGDRVPPELTLESVVAGSDGAWLGGTAWDDTYVLEVGWVNETTGASGLAEGTDLWTAFVPLAEGKNLVSIGVRDDSNNLGLISFTLERAGAVVLGWE